MKKIILYAEPYQALARSIAGLNGYKIGEIQRKTFPDGERYMRIKTDVRDRKVVLIGGAYDDHATMETFDLGCGLVHNGAKQLQIILPYLGYSTMERAVKYGEVVTAKNRARLFSSIPPAAYGNTFFAVDLHTGGLPHYFEGGTNLFHIYAKKVIMQAASQLRGNDFVLASTDAGRAKWVESLANDMGVPASFVFKRRLSGSETAVSAVSAQVDDRHVIIYDDMIRTGGSLIGAARAYKEAGAKTICAICTHGVFPNGALERIQQSKVIEAIICTDSHPQALHLKSLHPNYLDVLSLDTVIATALKTK
ncbi:MAG: ribose-phosphate diphosphokinase [Myxococcota bacterium]|nr:ribose-phosphate diphosphokinase [Myxococcota bacterium]